MENLMRSRNFPFTEQNAEIAKKKSLGKMYGTKSYKQKHMHSPKK